MKQMILFGEALIDFVPHQKGTDLKDVQHFQRCAGGAPANVAACIGRLGGEAAFIGQVGKDAFGDHIREILDRCHVDTRYLLQSDQYSTALAFVTLNAEGDRDFSFYRQRTADMMIKIDDIRTEVFDQGAVFHLGSNLFMEEGAYQTSLELVRKAREKGLWVSYDPNLRPILWPSQKVDHYKVLSIIGQVDIVKLSEEELYELYEPGLKKRTETEQIERVGLHDIDTLANQLLNQGPQLVLITLGEKGCYYAYRAAGQTKVLTGTVRSVHVEVVDATGAGDAFMGAFLYRLSSESSLEHLITGKRVLTETELQGHLRFANGVGAVATTKKGAIDGLPTLEEIESFLQQEGNKD